MSAKKINFHPHQVHIFLLFIFSTYFLIHFFSFWHHFTRTHTYTHTHTHIYIYIYIYTFVYIHILLHTFVFLSENKRLVKILDSDTFIQPPERTYGAMGSSFVWVVAKIVELCFLKHHRRQELTLTVSFWVQWKGQSRRSALWNWILWLQVSSFTSVFG